MAGSVSGQDEARPVLWLANWAAVAIQDFPLCFHKIKAELFYIWSWRDEEEWEV